MLWKKHYIKILPVESSSLKIQVLILVFQLYRKQLLPPLEKFDDLSLPYLL